MPRWKGGVVEKCHCVEGGQEASKNNKNCVNYIIFIKHLVKCFWAGIKVLLNILHFLANLD